MGKSIVEKLNKEWIFWDGGIGSLLQEMGLKGGELPETWNINRPNDIKKVHSDYLNAGCNVINTNTFGANRLKYPDNLDDIVTAGIKIAKDARDNFSASIPGVNGASIDQKIDQQIDQYIALDIGPTGKLLKPLGDLDFEDAVDIFGQVVRIGDREGVDLILIETMSDTYELKAAVLAAKENSDLPVFATVTFDAGGKLLTGGDVRTCVAMLEGLGVDALGVNCSLGPKELMPIVQELACASSIPVIVVPNAGLPVNENGNTVYPTKPDEFSDLMVDIAKLGVQVLGGCCGTTPKHIEEMIKKCKVLDFVPIKEKTKTYVSSFAQAVEIGSRPVIIGERINPTGKKAFKEALKNCDITYILNEGIKQEDSGADILDVNVGLPEIDEGEMMERVIVELQAVTSLPLQIDTVNVDALERGLRKYNGKALVNSVTGKKDSMDVVFPLVAKYGGVVVALPLDEAGIPETAEGRIEISKKIIAEAAKYGISKKDIIIDGLTLAISSGSGMGRSTLETIKLVRDELGCGTILGVSNVSFGLPARELINSTLLSMAILNGLSCAIINPGNEAMMNSYRSSLALLDYDENCSNFVEKYKYYISPAAGGGPVSSGAGTDAQVDKSDSSSEAGSDLMESIERGLAEKARSAAIEALQSREPLDIINEDLIPALDKVGQGFEKGEIFLPQLLMSAEATKAAFTVIKEALPEKSSGGKGKIVVATVKGDIHDIGKNIVKVLLENYGFQVIDLGKDVPPEEIVNAVIENDIKLVGLSALMTTTVSSMQETISELRDKAPGTLVVVSGAVLTQDYADMMGADHYAKDAMGTVRYAEEVLAI